MKHLNVKDVKPTQAELRRIVKDREFAQGFAIRKYENQQKRAWELYMIARNGKQPSDTRLAALRKMLDMGFGAAWWNAIRG